MCFVGKVVGWCLFVTEVAWVYWCAVAVAVYVNPPLYYAMLYRAVLYQPKHNRNLLQQSLPSRVSAESNPKNVISTTEKKESASDTTLEDECAQVEDEYEYD